MRTLDDLRRHRYEKSKQHKWRDKESDTKIDQDTRTVAKRVRVWGANSTFGARLNTIGNSGTTKDTWAPMFLHVCVLCLYEDIQS